MSALPSKSHRCPIPFPASALPPPCNGEGGMQAGTHPTARSRPHTCPGPGRRHPAPGGRPGEGRAGAPAPGSRGPAPAAGAASAAPRLTCRAGSTMAPSPGQGLGVLPSRGLAAPVQAPRPRLHVRLSLAVPWASGHFSLQDAEASSPSPHPLAGPLPPTSLNPSQASPPRMLQCETGG